MKYIKLFESFESIKLSKTLGFIKSGKDSFLEDIRTISKKKDFPFSQYSDEMFQYLPYRKALNFFWKPDQTTCKNCNGEGKYRRPWGRGTRVVDCKECEGTGKIKPETGKVSHIKFWFNSEGKYLGKTGIDGSVHEKSAIYIKGVKYKEDRTITPSELKNLPHESKALVRTSYTWVPGTIWKSGNSTWLIQDYSWNGSSRGPRGEQWKKWGEYGWNLDDYHIYERFKYPKTLVEKTDMDPLDFNYELRLNYAGSISMYKNSDIKPTINDAEFALILDISKITSNEKLSEIRLKRDDQKSGILKPEEIKSKNLVRYFDELSKKFEVSDDISNISKIATRIFGWRNCIFYIYSATNFPNFESIINEYFELIRSDKNDISLSRASARIKYLFSDSLNLVKGGNSTINENLINVKSQFKKSGNEVGYQFIEEISKLGDFINSKILNTKAETLSDLEIILQKVTSISNIITSSRYELSNFRYFLSRIRTTSWQNLYEELNSKSTESYTRAIEDIKTITNIIDRM